MDLGNALARAQKLMLDENFNRKVEASARALKGKSMNGGGGNDLSAFEAAAFGSAPSTPNRNYEMLQETPVATKKNTGIPSNILESFQQTPPMSGGMEMTAPSYLFENLQQQPSAPQRPVYQQPQYQQPQQQAGIDYEYIKYMINESVKNVVGQLLSEGGSTVKGMRIKDGNTIQFLDTKGNLYEGTLKVKKKAN